MKIILREDQVMDLRLKRRGIDIKKIGDIIEYQTEIQDPCDFDDAEEYVDFCIGQGLSFYYCDENYCDEDDEDYKEPSEEMLEVRDEVEEYLYNEFYDYLVDIYNDLKTDCE